MALIVANWKMNLNVAQSSILLERLAQKVEHSENTIVLCPSFVAVHSLYQAIRERKLEQLFKLGVQNINNNDEGAFTGEVSALQVSDLVDYAIIGHSERRIHFGESDELIAAKVAAALRNDLTPILCVGETLQEHESGETKRVIQDQMDTDLGEVSADELADFVIAYEPVWAIGTGNFATPDQAQAVMSQIRQFLGQRYGTEATKNLPILYGGSVTDENAKIFLACSDCGGLLVGGASLNDETFARIANA